MENVFIGVHKNDSEDLKWYFEKYSKNIEVSFVKNGGRHVLNRWPECAHETQMTHDTMVTE